MAGEDHTRTEHKKVASDPGTDPTYAAPATGAPAAPALVAADPERYERGREIARGGMGRIVAARDRRLGRPVALKELIAPDPGMAIRFEREALITARLQHPAIVNLYEAGRWPSGEPFYAMKLVAGRSFKEVIEGTASLDERLALLPVVIAVADALAYAHGQRIVHRDLKPANILVGDYGETVVIDWGLAKDLNVTEEALPAATVTGSSGSTSQLTVVGSVMGTPAFMSPEQAHGDPIDERSDVYAIGAILYHLLSGKPPYADHGTTDLLEGVLHGPPTPLREPLPPELIAIAGRAMARRPDHRYPSARELAEELRRFQTGKLVAAHQYTRRQLVRRWIRRNRTALLMAAAVVGAAAVTGGISIARIIAERERAEAAEASATSRADRLTVSEARAALSRDPLKSLALLAELGPRSRQWGAGRMIAADALARGLPRILRGPVETQRVLAADPKGRKVVTGGSDGAVWLWDPKAGTGRELYRHDREVAGVRFSSDGEKIVSWGADGALRVWDGKPRVVATEGAQAQDVAFAADGSALFVSSADSVRRFDLAGDGPSRGEALPLPQLPIGIYPSPDGKILAVTGLGTSFMLHDLQKRSTIVVEGNTDPVSSLTFSPDGKSIVTGSRDGTVRLWDVATAGERILGKHEGAVNDVAVSPDGQRIVSGGADRVARIWMPAGGDSIQLTGSNESVDHVAFSPDGTHVAASGKDPSVRVWDTTGGAARVLAVENGDATFAFLDGGGLAAIAGSAEVRVWDAAAAAPAIGDLIIGFASFPGTSRVVAVDLRGDASIWDVDHGIRLGLLASADGPAPTVSASPDGRTFATVASGVIRPFDTEKGGRAALPGYGVGPMVFSPDGKRLAAPGKLEPTVCVWDVATGAGRAYAGHEGWVYDVAFSPDGRQLVSGSADKTVRVWDLEAGTVRILAGHTGVVEHVAWSPDGRWLASAATDRTVRLWDLDRGTTRILPVESAARALAFAPGGGLLAAGDGKLLRLWSIAGGADQTLSGQIGRINGIAFAPDGEVVATGDKKSVRLWDVASGESRTVMVVGGNDTVADFGWAGDAVVVVAGKKLQVYRDDLPRDPAALRARLAGLVPVTPPRR